MARMTAAQAAGAFQQAFHLMRPGRPGPVLIDVQLAAPAADAPTALSARALASDGGRR